MRESIKIKFSCRHFYLSSKVDFVDLTVSLPNCKRFRLNTLSLKQIISLNT